MDGGFPTEAVVKRDADGFCAKDRVFLAWDADPGISPARAHGHCASAVKLKTVEDWLDRSSKGYGFPQSRVLGDKRRDNPGHPMK
jgi:hypothetical protein